MNDSYAPKTSPEPAYAQSDFVAGLLKAKQTIAVFPHNTADGDTLGSCIAVSIALLRLGKDVKLVYEEAFPDNLSVLPSGYDFFTLYQGDPGVFAGSFDAIVVCDAADSKLLGKREALLGGAGCVVNIDHHISNNEYGDYNLIDPDSSSTAEIIYQLILDLGVPLDYDIAVSIYTGVCTDTGGFSYANTTSKSHIIAARTIEFGIEVARLRYKFFDAITLGKLYCHGYVANSLKIHDGGRYAIAIVTASALAEIGATEADCEGLVNLGRNVTGVIVSAFAREVRPGEFRINLRSRGEYDVAALACIFGGGGHKMAAGCTIFCEPPDVEAILLDALRRCSGT